MKKKDQDQDTSTYSAFPTKFSKKLPEGFSEKAETMTLEELKKQLVQCETTISSTEKDMENDQKLLDAKEEVTNLAGDYKEILASYKAMVRYIVFVLNGRDSV